MARFKNTLMFSFGTLISRLLGLVRDRVLASYFGATIFVDAFHLAFRIPNLFRDMLAEGALSQAFTKTYSQLEGEEEKLFLNRFLANIFVLAFVLSILGYWIAPFLVDLLTYFAKDMDNKGPLIVTAKNLSRIMFIFLPIMMIAATLMGALHKHGRFFITSVASAFFNIGFIGGVLFCAPLAIYFLPRSVDLEFAPRPLIGLSVGVLMGAFFQAGIYAWKMRRYIDRSVLRPCLSPKIKETFLLMAPAAIAASTGPINNVVNTNFATTLESGSITWLYYGFRLFQLPVGLFGVALGVVLLPELSKLIKIDHQKFINQLRISFWVTVWVMAWFTVCMFFASHSVMDLLFKTGAFTATDVMMSSWALQAYSLGLIGYGLIKVLTNYYYITHRTIYPMKVAFFCVFLNFGLNYFMVQRFNHVGLALTAGLVLSINGALLFAGVYFKDPSILNKGVRQLVSLICAVALSSGIVWFLQAYFGPSIRRTPNKYRGSQNASYPNLNQITR